MDGSEAARRMVVGSTTTMRFRPIAPKPPVVVGGSVSSSVESRRKSSPVSKGRTKRKYVRVRRYNNNKNNRKKKTTGADDDDESPPTMTLQLLPERHDVERDRKANGERSENDVVLTSDPGGAAVVELWVTDACSSCMDLEKEHYNYRTEERIRKQLDEDTCPAFVSDGMNRVEWLNTAFKRMVMMQFQRSSDHDDTDPSSSASTSTSALTRDENKIQVRLITSGKPKLSSDLEKVATWQIKVEFKNKKRKLREIRVPCDAWRLNGGGFAWKLDVKAALTLDSSQFNYSNPNFRSKS